MALLAALTFAPAARAQSSPAFQCSATNGVPPTIRAEGLSELIGDFVLTCSGGTPTASGSAAPTANITLFLSTEVTNRFVFGTGSPAALATKFTDALLIVDEPHSPDHPNVPLLACGSPSSNDTGTGLGVCSILGTGSGVNTYNGASGRPNVFQGVLESPNTIVWKSVPMDAIGAINKRTFRITNVRVNVNQAASAAATPNLIKGYVSITGSTGVPVADPEQVLALWQPGLNTTTSSIATLSQCTAANPSAAADPTQPLDTGGQNGAQFTITLREGAPSAFKPKNIAERIANAPVSNVFGANHPADSNQNIPGTDYRSEMGFFNSAADPASIVPTLPSTANFPAVHGLDQAGIADQGARLFLNFGSTSGMRIFVPVRVPLLSAEPATLGQQTGVAVLVSTDSSGAGPWSPIAGNGSGLAALPSIGSGSGAAYEILYSDSQSLETITIPVAAAYAANQVSGGQQTTVQTWLAPIDARTSADQSAPLARFAFSGTTPAAFLVRPCGQPDLTVSMSHSGTFAPGGSGAFSISVRNSGDTTTASSVTASPSLSSGLAASAISGSGWSCTLSPLACTRSDTLSANSNYPPITLAVTVAATPPASVIGSVTVSGGAETLTNNNSASDAVNPVALQSITVGTAPAGLGFTVDNATYTSAQTFQWVTGSTHTISTFAPQLLSASTYIFDHWSDFGVASHTITVPPSPATYTATFGSTSSTMLCIAAAGVGPTVRVEGLAEGAGDVVLNCSGGTPTPSGSPIPQVDFHLSFNTTVTAKIAAPAFSEALLFVDEPHSLSNPTVPLLVCGAANTNDNGSGSCARTGDGAGTTTYNGSAGHPNVFQGQLNTANELIWRGVPIDPPGPGITRVFRFTNLRINANALGLTPAPGVTQAVTSVGVTPGGLAIQNPNQTVAFIQSGINTSGANAPSALSQCLNSNPAIVADPTVPLDSGGQNGAQFSISLVEGFGTSFRVKNLSQLLANNRYPSPLLYPADSNQNVLTATYNTESLFQNNGADPSPNPFGSISPTPVFPSIRGLLNAGRADSGSRIYLRFSPVPVGIKLFLPATLPLRGFFGNTGVLSLTSTDLNGAGPYTPVAANAAGLTQLSVLSGSALAVYEVLGSDAFSLETLTVPVAAAFVANLQANQPALGAMNVEYGLAPLSNVATASSTDPEPRFAPLGNTRVAFNIQACAQAILSVALSHGNFVSGQAGAYTITVRNAVNALASNGSVSVTETLSNGFSLLSMSGSGWACAGSTCSRADGIAPGASYPPITVNVNVSANLQSTFTNQVTVSGGGSANAAASDTATVIACSYSISPLSVTLDSTGTHPVQSVTVATSSPSCPWSVNSNGFATVVSQSAGSFTYSVPANPGGYRSTQLTIAGLPFTVNQLAAPLASITDYDGDGKTDFGTFRPSTGLWSVLPSSTRGTSISQSWGIAGDISVVGDFDGDHTLDIAVYRPGTGTWYVIPSSTGVQITQGWGIPGDQPVPADYDGDGKTDFAVYRPSTGTWFVIPSSDPTHPIVQSWGIPGDQPVQGDFDGDGKKDFAVFRPSTQQWFVIRSSNPSAPIATAWGIPGDVPVPADFDGDGRTDLAVWRASTGTWFVLPTTTPGAYVSRSWGIAGDIPLLLDADADRKTDFAVYRPSTQTWYVIQSSNGAVTTQNYGIPGDKPLYRAWPWQ